MTSKYDDILRVQKILFDLFLYIDIALSSHIKCRYMIWIDEGISKY